MSTRKSMLAFVLAATVAASSLVSGQEPPPSGRDIIAKYLAAMGGEAAFRAVKSISARGRFEIAAQGISGELEIYSARPARLLYRVTVSAIGRIETGYDGKVGWMMTPIAGPELLTGTRLLDIADDAYFDGPLHAADHVREVTTLGRADFDGRAAFRVKTILRSGNEQVEYFDVDSGLLLGSEATRAIAQGNIPTVHILRDYRRFGRLLQATTSVERAMGFEQTVTLTSVEYDAVPDSVFDLPPAVKALIAP
jgi:hypothetical protein